MNTYIFIRNKKYRPSSYYRVVQYLKKDYKNFIEYEVDLFYMIKKNHKLVVLLTNILFQLIPGYSRRIINLFKIILKEKEYCIYVQRAVFPKFIGPLGKYLFRKVVDNAKFVYWDFDDNIIDSQEITSFERKLLEEKSTLIIVPRPGIIITSFILYLPVCASYVSPGMKAVDWSCFQNNHDHSKIG